MRSASPKAWLKRARTAEQSYTTTGLGGARAYRAYKSRLATTR
jgi:hypothetical protein